MNRDSLQTRQIQTKFTATRTDGDNGERVIEGYFAVYNQETELWRDAFEVIKPGAFANTLGNDIRALTNHDTTLVLGRNKSGTLELKEDARGLWGRIKINENDTDAVNLYERVKRGDVDQCSFGFNVVKETTEHLDNGGIRWSLEEIDLHEVSVCTFPAYEQTGVQARKQEMAQYKQRQLEQKKNELKERLKHGIKASNDNAKS